MRHFRLEIVAEAQPRRRRARKQVQRVRLFLRHIQEVAPLFGQIQARGYEPADDDILFQPAQVVFLAVDGGFGEDARGLLEGRRRQEAVHLEGRPGDAEQYRARGGGFAALCEHVGGALIERLAVDLVAGQQTGIAGLLYLNLA